MTAARSSPALKAARLFASFGRVAASIVALATVVLAAPPARADSQGEAKDLFARGRALRAKGECGGAVPLFERAIELYPAGLGSLRNLAECQETLGRFASARRSWLDLKRALVAEHDPKYAGWDDDAEQAAVRLTSKVSSLAIDVKAVTASGQPAGSVDGVDVTVNGERLSSAQRSAPIERDAGWYIISAAGKRVALSSEQTIELGPGQSKHVVLDVVVRPPSSAPGEPVSPPSVEHVDSGRRVAAWVALSVGAAGLVGVGISAALRQSALNDYSSDGCFANSNGTYGGCDPSSSNVQATYSRGQTATDLLRGFAVVGALGAVTGVVLMVTSSSQEAVPAVVVSPQQVSALWRF